MPCRVALCSTAQPLAETTPASFIYALYKDSWFCCVLNLFTRLYVPHLSTSKPSFKTMATIPQKSRSSQVAESSHGTQKAWTVSNTIAVSGRAEREAEKSYSLHWLLTFNKITCNIVLSITKCLTQTKTNRNYPISNIHFMWRQILKYTENLYIIIEPLIWVDWLKTNLALSIKVKYKSPTICAPTAAALFHVFKYLLFSLPL